MRHLSKSELDIEMADSEGGSAGAARPEPLALAFSRLSYTLRVSGADKLILDSVSAYFLPGRMAALMGPSGAGKTTLLDAVAGRKTQGTLACESLVFGTKRPSTNFLKRRTGYVEQFDTLVHVLTVEEMLRYTAELKRPEGESADAKARVVDDILEKLALGHVRGHVIGDPMARGISGGQAKRVNIGIALVTEPQILFLDEPTTGLDSATAEDIMAMVKALAIANSYTVVSTIHSPSTRTFRNFDDLLLLSKGRTVYFGPLADAAPLAYFGRLGVSPDPAAVASVRFNLAEWLIAVTGGGVKGVDPGGMDFPGAYEASPLRQAAEERLRELLPPPGTVPPKHSGDRETTTSMWKGFVTLFLYRSLKKYGDQTFLGPRVFEKFMMSFVIFSLFLLTATKDDPSSLQTTVGCVFLMSGLTAFGAVAFVPGLFLEKKLYTRERNDGCYYALTYIINMMVTEAIPALVGVIILNGTLFFSIGFKGNFGLFLLGMYLNTMCSIGLGYTIAAAMPTMDIANMSMIGFMVMQMFFVGMLVLENSIPAYWAWFRYLCFFRYTWRAFMVNHFTGAGDPVLFPGNGDRSTVLQFYNLIGESDWANVGYLAIFVLGYITLAWLAMSYIKHEKR